MKSQMERHISMSFVGFYNRKSQRKTLKGTLAKGAFAQENRKDERNIPSPRMAQSLT